MLCNQTCYHRSIRTQCAALCTANPDCVAYYNNVTECLETDGVGLMGALPSSPNAMTVYIDSSQDPGNAIQMKLCHHVLTYHTRYSLTGFT